MVDSPGSDSILPMIFQTSTLTYEERYVVYKSFIFGDCRPLEVKAKLGNYVELCVRKSGWKAVWSCDVQRSLVASLKNEKMCNVLVEVIIIQY